MTRLSGHSSVSAIYSSTGALTALAGLAVVARLYTRFYVAKRAGWDDGLVTIAMIFSIAMGVTICKQADYGMGRHIWTLTLDDIHGAGFWFWACYWLYYFALYFTKLSILFQYIRIFPYDRLRTLAFLLMGVVSVWSAWAVCSSIFMCVPIQNFWLDPSPIAPHCMHRLAVWYANAAVNIASDIAIFLLPLPYIKALEIPKQQKILLLGVFGVGFFTCFVSVLRLVYIYPVTTSPDMSWENCLANIWSCVEVNVGILCSCAPTLKGAFQRGIPKLLSSLRSSSTAVSDSRGQGSRFGIGSFQKLTVNSNEKSSGFGSFLSSRLASSTKSSSRSLNRSYGGEEPDMPTDGIEIVTIVDQTSEPARPGEFVTKGPQHGRQNSVLTTGKSTTIIEARSNPSVRPADAGQTFFVDEEDSGAPEKALHAALGVS